jgi:hypothetical protein
MKKGLYINLDLNKQEVGLILFEAAQNFVKSFQIFKNEINKSKTYSSLCPLQGLFNTTLMQIQSGRTVHLKRRVIRAALLYRSDMYSKKDERICL